jgi:hypothetical protein
MSSLFLALLFSLQYVANSQEITFESFVKKYGYTWTPDSEEWNNRRSVFDKELERVRLHNAGGHSWTETINKFSVYNDSEKKVCS